MHLEFDFSTPIGKSIEKPKNSYALCLYLLLEAGLHGIDNYEAVVKGRNWKFNTRLSELIKRENLNVHKKDELGTNQFGHPYTSKRYCLFECDLTRNIEIYKKINK